MLVARPYQSEARREILKCWDHGQTTLAVLATGLGKTFIAAEVIAARQHLGRAMFVAHRAELVKQAVEVMDREFGKGKAVVEMGERNANASLFGAVAPIVVTSVQTQFSGANGRGRMTRFDPREFATLIIDEAHHYIAPAYKRVIDHYLTNPELRALGITATPDRADKLAMGRLFGSVAYNYGICPGVTDGWLVGIDQFTGNLEDMDLSRVETRGGDLSADQVAQVMEKYPNCFGVAKHTLERAGERRTLVFASSVMHARMLTALLNDRRPDSARYVTAETDPEERAKILDDYAKGRFQFLCNVGIATEGFNDPGIEVVVIARPTKSRSLFTQMVGRGTRPLPGVVDRYEHADDRKVAIAESAKPAVEVVDFAGNAGRHKLVTAADILGGDYEAEIVRRVNARAAAGEAVNVSEALAEEWAKDKRERERSEQAELERLARIRAEVDCEFRRVDPFGRAGDVGSETLFPVPQQRRKEPTAGMLRFLDAHAPKGVDPRKLSFGEAGKLIGEINKRRDAGLCSIDVAKVLASKGLPADVPRAEAAAWMDRLKANKWQVPLDVRMQALAYQNTRESA